jgi:acetyltransferase-like isoleucine patch superfamily enzyme
MTKAFPWKLTTLLLLTITLTLALISAKPALDNYIRLSANDVELDGTVHFQELHLAKNCGPVTCHYKFGKHVRLGNAAISGNIEIGDNTSLGKDTELYGNVKIGRNVVIQSHVYINGREYYKENGIWHLNLSIVHNITIPDGAWIPISSQIRNQADADRLAITK